MIVYTSSNLFNLFYSNPNTASSAEGIYGIVPYSSPALHLWICSKDMPDPGRLGCLLLFCLILSPKILKKQEMQEQGFSGGGGSSGSEGAWSPPEFKVQSAVHVQ